MRVFLPLALALACALPCISACGGFFCSQSTPVFQAGERIVFSVDQTNIEMFVQINYVGPAEKFSWVLPMPSVPTAFDVSSDKLFTALTDATAPRFEVDFTDNPECPRPICPNWVVAESSPVASGDPASGGVIIKDEGAVGPFDYVVIGSGNGQAVFDWLNDNGYDQPPEALPLIEDYVALNMVFVLLKLQKDKDVGDMQPIKMDYNMGGMAALACIPVVLTKIAASDDMPILTWVLSDKRSVPTNYFDIQPNYFEMDLMKCGLNNQYGGGGSVPFFSFTDACAAEYKKVASAAIDKAPRGFITLSLIHI